MPATPVIAIFDIGKTNKKLFLFDEDYKIVYEESHYFPETVDEDGDACEDLQQLQNFVYAALQQVLQSGLFNVKAVNFSTYGASFVHIDESGTPVTPLYNYLKPYPAELLRQFYATYGGEAAFSVDTASPVLGHLNSGLQLYWLKWAKPQLYKKIRYSLHLPQYMAFLLTGNCFSDLTSIGCHTGLWHFAAGAYHEWVAKEGVLSKMAPVVPATHVVHLAGPDRKYSVGVGLHDSSAALIPYLASFAEPFVLLSTGTWCISLNPFDHSALTYEELQQDCLCYLAYDGKPVKAARLFAGYEHEQQVQQLGIHFGKAPDYYKTVRFDIDLLRQQPAKATHQERRGQTPGPSEASFFAKRDLASCASYEAAYHQLVMNLVAQQVAATQLVLKGAPVKKLFVDGGFGNNAVYMHLLAKAFPAMEVYAAKMAQATALGAAVAIHAAWNSRKIRANIIELKYYSADGIITGREPLVVNNSTIV